MKEELITFETAKLGKQKGFDWSCFGNYHVGRINGKDHVVQIQMYEHDWNTYLEPNRTGYQGKKSDQGQLTTSAPTQSLLQRWLREVHHIHIGIWYNTLTSKYRWERQIGEDYVDSNEEFPTYELALSEGLTEALKLF